MSDGPAEKIDGFTQEAFRAEDTPAELMAQLAVGEDAREIARQVVAGRKMQRDNGVVYSAALEAAQIALRAKPTDERLRIGCQVEHLPSGARGEIVENVEGWWEVRTKDGTTVVCRPSNLARIDTALPETAP